MYTWRVFDDLKPAPNSEYINDCCEFCDSVLENIKPEISKKLKIDLNDIIIGQEDWGWYLEFQKDEIVYILSISYQDKTSKAYNFSVVFEAQKTKKGFLFNRKIEAESECQEFAEDINQIAEQNNIQVFEDDGTPSS